MPRLRSIQNVTDALAEFDLLGVDKKPRMDTNEHEFGKDFDTDRTV